MKFYITKKFKKKYKKMPKHIKKLSKKQMEILLSDPQHPSLNVKKMQDPRNIWEARISDSYRFTFQINKDVYLLRNIGTHDIIGLSCN